MPKLSVRRASHRLRLSAAALALTFLASGCAISASPAVQNAANRIRVITSIYPLEFLTAEVAGPNAQVTSMLPPGADAHHSEVSLRQLRRLEEADLLVFLSDFQPAIDAATRSNPPAHIFDVADHITLHPYGEGDHDHDHEHDHHHGPIDPHFWLDPTNLATLAPQLAEQLAVLNSANAANYRARAADLATKLTDLATEFSDRLANCQSDTVVVSHAAFGYLTNPLQITQIGIAGLDPDSEPSLARIRQIRDTVSTTEVTTIFYESPTNPYVAQKVADALGLQTAFLDPLELQHRSDQDYLAVMKQNLTALETALECR